MQKRNYLFLFILIGALAPFLSAQQIVKPTKNKTSHSWSASPFEQKVFVENKGQADAKIIFSASSGGVSILFSKTGVKWEHEKRIAEKTNSFFQKNENEEKIKTVSESMEMEWVDANPDVKITPEQKVKFYYTFGEGKRSIVAAAYSKIVYHNLYPGIDVEYIMPADKIGVKYSIIVHPGADVSKIKMNYKDASVSNSDGNIFLKSAFGDLIDHAPQTFYTDSKEEIKSFFIFSNNTVSFKLAHFSSSETIVIDPWTSNPNFPGYNAAYDINFDNAGNVLAYGSLSPLKLAKFDNTGALQWIYNLTGGSYAYGDFAVDEGTGISYICEGKTGPTLVHKINTSGVDIAQSTGVMGEMWRMVFNRSTNEIVIAGGSGPNYAAVMDTALNHFELPMGTQDMVLLAIDNCGPNNCYMANCQVNTMYGMPASTLGPTFFQVPDGYAFTEVGSVTYVGGSGYAADGFNGMTVSNNWLYTYNGALLKRWDKNSGAFITSNVISGTPYLQGGLDADECENIFIGVNNSILVLDQNFNTVTTFPLPDNVYDLKLGKTNILYACGKNFVTSIDLPPPLSNIVTVSQTPAGCNVCNGITSASISNLCTSSSYLWMPGGQTTSTATGLCAGLYTVTITTGCNKVFSDTITVAGSPPITLNASPVNILCNGQTNGASTAVPSGGTSPYTYSWSNSQTTATATGLSAGTYTVVVTDANGCSQTTTVTITQPPVLIASITFTNTTCGNSNGTISSLVSGGTPGYTYAWSPSGGTNANATGLSPGSYTLTVTDANGCTVALTQNIAPSTGPTVSLASQINDLCNGTSTGSANITASGNGPFTYAWSPSGGTNTNATGLAAGTYTCTVTDVNGCTQTQTVTITQPTAISVTTNATSTNCTGNTGTATATASGGTAGYSYSWNNSQTTQTATGLASGTYTVTVTDANGCTQTQTVTVTTNNPVTVSTSVTQSSCAANDGTATATPANGTAPYTYSWSNGQTTQIATGLGAGNYSVTVTDANGCSQTQTVTVSQTAGPSAGIMASLTTINPGGSSQLSATGGGTYSWAPSSGLSCTTCMSPIATPGQTTTYCVFVTDANGCTDSKCVTINVEIPCVLESLKTILPNAFSPNSDASNDQYCVPENTCIQSFVLKIYDRWGEKVFQTEDLSKCWDGIYKGKNLNTDVFVYYFDAVLSNGDTFKQKGNISLIR